MKALRVENLYKKYPTFTLERVSFSVEEGHIVGLIGRNGAGKTTALKAVMRLIAAEGKTEVFGRDFAECEAAVKSEIGFVSGGFNFYPYKKIGKIVRTVASFYPTWGEKICREYLARFDIDENKKPSELSAGMKVKLSVALALSHGARLFVMDEPTSGLDPVSREEFNDLTLALSRERGASVLFSTHITSDLMRVADDAVYISDGRILKDAPLKVLLGEYEKVTFPSEGAAKDCGAEVIGLKAVRDGTEGLIARGAKVSGALRREDADLDAVMIHLEAQKQGGRHAETH